MEVIEQLISHFWARGALSPDEAKYLVKHGFAREEMLPGLVPITAAPRPSDLEEFEREWADILSQRAEDQKAREAEELENELVGRNAGSRKSGGKKKKPTGHNLAPAIDTLTAHIAQREPYPALVELGSRITNCSNWHDAAKAVAAAKPESLETALVALLNTRPRALGELWFWFDLEPLFEWTSDPANTGPVAVSLAKLLRADNLAQVGRLDQLRKAPEVQMLLDLLAARRAFNNLLPVLYHAYFPKLGQWLIPPTGTALACWPALPWSFVIVYNARQGTKTNPPLGYTLVPATISARLLRMALTTALAQAPVAVRELLLSDLREAEDPIRRVQDTAYPIFARHLYCPYTWRV